VPLQRSRDEVGEAARRPAGDPFDGVGGAVLRAGADVVVERGEQDGELRGTPWAPMRRAMSSGRTDRWRTGRPVWRVMIAAASA
jgi:hypothetical protein